MRTESSECSGAWSVLGESAIAERINSRFVSDLDPGTAKRAVSAPEARGADQPDSPKPVGVEYLSPLIGS